jgi:hypothetical protein
MFNNDWDPYERIVELEKFARVADQHLANLLKNQQEMVKAHNANIKKVDAIVKSLNELRFDLLKLETLIKENLR